MSRRVIQLPVTLGGVVRKVDRSVSMRFTTNTEVSNDDFATLDTFMGHSGFLLFSENELQAEDVPKDDAPGREVKSKGQRMRAIWYLKHKKRGIEEPFESWYDRMFEGWMDRWKEELDD